ncbi:hypothetical protein APTSU1_000589900 [Apodemus speciosus]|uniref:Uncharacterized protein n=1 Tax=Apodemus speciosus TaxID=105296 RepID=A0ABQ0EUF8_APOSI
MIINNRFQDHQIQPTGVDSQRFRSRHLTTSYRDIIWAP